MQTGPDELVPLATFEEMQDHGRPARGAETRAISRRPVGVTAASDSAADAAVRSADKGDAKVNKRAEVDASCEKLPPWTGPKKRLGVMDMVEPYQRECTEIHNYALLNAMLTPRQGPHGRPARCGRSRTACPQRAGGSGHATEYRAGA